MKHKQPLSFAPIDIEELLSIGGNATYAEGVLVFDNLSYYTNDMLSKRLFVKMLIKPKVDILVICLDGELKYILDSCQPVCLRKGNLAFFHQDQIVELNEHGATATIIMVAFPHEMTIGIRGLSATEISHDSVLFTPSDKELTNLTNIYSQIRKVVEDNTLLYRKDIIQMYARILMMFLSDIVFNGSENTSHKTDNTHFRRKSSLYNDFTRLVKENYRQQRKVGYYADKLCVSSEHLTRVVKAVSGKSACEWIRDYIVLEAKVLLKSSDMTINQISDTLNFPNPSFFTKFFRKGTGLSPSTYRTST